MNKKIFLRCIFVVLAFYLIVQTTLESFTLDGQLMEIQVYIFLYGTGLILLICALFLDSIYKASKQWVVFRIFIIGTCLGFLFLSVIAGIVYITPFFVEQVDGSESALLVLGAPVVNDEESSVLSSRIDKLKEFTDKNSNIPIVVSGGYGEAIYIDQKVDIENVMLEEKATSTMENIKYSKSILDSYLDVKRDCIAVLTNPFHIFRTSLYLQSQGYEHVHYVMASTPSSTRLLWSAREVLLIFRYLVFGLS